jgi:hypothetical protein
MHWGVSNGSVSFGRYLPAWLARDLSIAVRISCAYTSFRISFFSVVVPSLQLFCTHTNLGQQTQLAFEAAINLAPFGVVKGMKKIMR